MKAAEVLERYWDGSIPVNPVSIANAMGVQVFKMPMEDGASGFVETNDGTHTITVNQNDVRVRQRFTIAHEIGHIALGHTCDGTKVLRDTAAAFMSGNKDPKEVDANSFAAQLLMPERLVRTWFDRMIRTDITEAARMFDVSEAAIYYRLVNLGLVRG